MDKETIRKKTMKKIIRLEVEVPDQATDEEIEEYFQFEFGYNSCCSNDNPFISEYDYEVTDFEMED